jgi:hypothetical protein
MSLEPAWNIQGVQGQPSYIVRLSQKKRSIKLVYERTVEILQLPSLYSEELRLKGQRLC